MININDNEREPLVEIEKKPNDGGWLYHFGWSKKTGRELD